METTKEIWQSGKWTPWEESTTHVITHSLHYGGAVFEGIRIYDTPKGPAIFRLEDHLKRLFYSAKTIALEIRYTQKELEAVAAELVKRNEIKDGYLRPLAYYGYGKMGLNPVGAPPEIFLACWPWTNYLSDVPAIKVKISKYMRLHPKSVVVDAKVSGYYANSILASLEVRAEGYHEALFLDFQGNVAEGPGENMFIVKNGTVITPPGDFILPGFTRDTILKLAKDLGLKTEEKNFKPEDIYSADEAFMTGTASEVAPIENVDGKTIGKGGVGKITEQLKQAYLDVVHGKNPKYEHWLTYCV